MSCNGKIIEKEKILCLKMTEMIGDQLFKQVVITEVNPHAFARIVEKKNHLANLASEIWVMARLEINLGVKIVDRDELIVNGKTGGYVLCY